MTTCERKKHPCPDCRQCQNCSSTRCSLCRGQGAEKAERRFSELSLAGQIELFEAVNRGDQPEGGYGGTGENQHAKAFQIISPWTYCVKTDK